MSTITQTAPAAAEQLLEQIHAGAIDTRTLERAFTCGETEVAIYAGFGDGHPTIAHHVHTLGRGRLDPHRAYTLLIATSDHARMTVLLDRNGTTVAGGCELAERTTGASCPLSEQQAYVVIARLGRMHRVLAGVFSAYLARKITGSAARFDRVEPDEMPGSGQLLNSTAAA